MTKKGLPPNCEMNLGKNKAVLRWENINKDMDDLYQYITSKVAFAKKVDQKGLLQRFKARLLMRGFEHVLE